MEEQERQYYDGLERAISLAARDALVEFKQGLVGDKAFMQVCRDKIDEFFTAVKEEAEYLDLTYRSYVLARDDQKHWYLWTIERSKERKAALEKELRKWQYELEVAKGKQKRDEVNVVRAKSVPIDLLLGKTNSGTRARRFYTCPFHTDKTPSMCWYVAQNKVHCFSCGWGGDVIDVFMKLHNCDFVTAINSLNKY